jgi:hypothetical protein
MRDRLHYITDSAGRSSDWPLSRVRYRLAFDDQRVQGSNAVQEPTIDLQTGTIRHVRKATLF